MVCRVEVVSRLCGLRASGVIGHASPCSASEVQPESGVHWVDILVAVLSFARLWLSSLPFVRSSALWSVVWIFRVSSFGT